MVDGGDFDGNKAYKDSKLCGVLFARALSKRLEPIGATACAFSPGFVPTSSLFRFQTSFVRTLLKTAFNYPPLATSLRTAGAFTAHMALSDAVTAAAPGAYFCGPPSFSKPEDAHPWLGGFARGLIAPEFGVKAPSEEARDDALAEALWEVSEALIDDALARREDQVLKDRRSPRERGRMGTSVTQNGPGPDAAAGDGGWRNNIHATAGGGARVPTSR
jgi:protochlorophyllide reductase